MSLQSVEADFRHWARDAVQNGAAYAGDDLNVLRQIADEIQRHHDKMGALHDALTVAADRLAYDQAEQIALQLEHLEDAFHADALAVLRTLTAAA